MVARWLSNAVQRFLSFFSSDEENTPNDAHQETSAISDAQQGPTSSHAHWQQQGSSSGDSKQWGAGQWQAPNDARWSQGPSSPNTEYESYSYQSNTAEVNSELYDNAFRRSADEHRRMKKELFKKAGEARKRGDYATANKNVDEAKEHTQLMKEANEKAVEYIMKINKNNTENTIDLHGLYVVEALEQLKKKLQVFTNGVLRVIPGRGSHSTNHEAKLKPKIVEYLIEHNYRFEEDNPGSLSVYL